ncbi:hypothetical protein H4582DRAFT_2109905 [Lactarius indigo]|nr:hypothetical protein H4582DRAFT_2109905 [Lactarius indigo]
MSAHKYSNLPDIVVSSSALQDSSGKDVYETEDTFQSVRDDNNDSSDDEGVPSRSRKVAEHSAAEGIDESSLVDPTEASRRFRRAERKRTRERSLYKYPPSRTPSPTPTHPPSLALRLKLLQSELTSLESELADPASPLLIRDREQGQVDPGDLLKDWPKFSTGHEGRARLVQDVLRDPPLADQVAETTPDKNATADGEEAKASHKTLETAKDIAGMDRRVGDLEKLIGSASTSLDESSAMPTPLLPLLTRLNTQLTVLAQPRHLDNISRRLKLLLSDLDRLAAANQQHRRGATAENDGSTNTARCPPRISSGTACAGSIPSPTSSRACARSRLCTPRRHNFANALSALEEEQRQSREALDALTQAIEGNGRVVKGNVAGLEERIDALTTRLDKLGG